MIEGPVIVTGLPRSGTSLMMRILSVSGFRPVCDEMNSYECKMATPKAMQLSNDWILDLIPGECVKVMFPACQHLPHEIPYHILWMTRNPREQAKSHRKFFLTLGKPFPRQALKQREKWIRDVNTRGPLIFGETPLLRVPFDTLVEHPTFLKRQIEDFLGLPLLFDVIKTRSARCTADIPVASLELSNMGGR